MIPPEERDFQAAVAAQRAWRLNLAAHLLMADALDPRFPDLLDRFRSAIARRELSWMAALDEAERMVAAANNYRNITTRQSKAQQLAEEIQRAWQDPALRGEKSEVAATMIAERFGVSQRTVYRKKPKSLLSN